MGKGGHTVLGSRMLACRRGFHEAKVRRVLVALHHHRDYANRSGSPPPLFGRIVRIAEDCDNYNRPWHTLRHGIGAMARPAPDVVPERPHLRKQYVRHEPESSVLYQVVQAWLETFLAMASEAYLRPHLLALDGVYHNDG